MIIFILGSVSNMEVTKIDTSFMTPYQDTCQNNGFFYSSNNT